MLASFSDEIVSVTNLRKDLPAMLDRVRSGVPVTIMQGDRADLVVVKRADLAAMIRETQALRDQLAALAGELETRETLDDPDRMESIRWDCRSVPSLREPAPCARAAWSRWLIFGATRPDATDRVRGPGHRACPRPRLAWPGQRRPSPRPGQDANPGRPPQPSPDDQGGAWPGIAASAPAKCGSSLR